MTSWQEQARSLTFGSSRKIVHCGSSPSAHINNTSRGISLYCHRCGADEFERHVGLSFADKMRMRKDAQELRRYTVRPATVGLALAPPDAWLWLLKAGLTPERAEQDFGICWIPKFDRVLLPVLEQGVDTGGWVARSLLKGVPKYVASASSDGLYWSSPNDGSGSLVVVEDVLSAIAVHRAGFMALAVMGTAFPLPLMATISRQCRTVVPWLDPDAGGAKGVAALNRAASSWPLTVTAPIRSERDPKYYPAQQIRELIRGTL